jgi:glucose-1-phosphatase
LPDSPPQALLFDLGGVLVDIDFSRALAAWAKHSRLTSAQLKQHFRFDTAYERHERGQITAAEYFAHLTASLQLAATPAQVEEGWNAIFVGEITATRVLVERARRQVPCFAFTNTNASHMARWSQLYPRVVGAFDRIFASHQMGLRKPEPAAFAHICAATGLPAHAIAFFDDLPENVQAAADAGFRATLVRSPGDVARALEGFGLQVND